MKISSVANFYNWIYVLKKMHRNKTVILVRQKVSLTQYYVPGHTVNKKEKVKTRQAHNDTFLNTPS